MLELVSDEIAQREAKVKQEGRQEGLRETARQMKADGLPVASICKYTGLSAEEVVGL